MKSKNFTRLFFNPILLLATTTVTTCSIATPSHAVEIIFSSPRVLSGINGVSFTFPSTGVTGTYNITLKRGTLADVFGTPPKFDVSNETDAVSVMDKSAQGINSFLSRNPGDISFESFGTNVFYLPYGINSATGLVEVSRSSYASPGITPDITELQPGIPVIYADIVPVPEPLTILGTGTALGFGVILKKRELSKKQKTEAMKA